MGDNERLYAVELHLQLERFSPTAGLKLGTARAAGQRYRTPTAKVFK